MPSKVIILLQYVTKVNTDLKQELVLQAHATMWNISGTCNQFSYGLVNCNDYICQSWVSLFITSHFPPALQMCPEAHRRTMWVVLCPVELRTSVLRSAVAYYQRFWFGQNNNNNDKALNNLI